MRRIVVPLDGAAFGEHALARAIALAKRHRAVLDLAHVHEVASIVHLEGVPVIDASVELEGMENDRGYLDRTLARVREVGVDAVASLLDGPTVGALEEHVRRSRADLVVMATHGRGALRRAWMGSVADGLVRHTTRPVLLIRARDEADASTESAPLDAPVPPLRRVLLGIERSDDEAPLREAAALVAEDDALVTGVQIGPGSGTKDAAAALLEAAAHSGADLVAVALHAGGGLSERVFGGTADKVIGGATVPVLLQRV